MAYLGNMAPSEAIGRGLREGRGIFVIYIRSFRSKLVLCFTRYCLYFVSFPFFFVVEVGLRRRVTQWPFEKFLCM